MPQIEPEEFSHNPLMDPMQQKLLATVPKQLLSLVQWKGAHSAVWKVASSPHGNLPDTYGIRNYGYHPANALIYVLTADAKQRPDLFKVAKTKAAKELDAKMDEELTPVPPKRPVKPQEPKPGQVTVKK